MTSVFRISLDIHQTQSQVSIPATQGADNVRLIIRLTEKGNPFDIEDGSYAIFSAVKPDGNPLYNDCAIYRNSTIVYDFTPQTTAVEGITKCQIHLYDTYGRKLHSPRFQIVVHPDIYGNEIESTEEYEALAKFVGIKNDIEQDISNNAAAIADLKKTVSSAGYVTIPVSQWEDGSPAIAEFTLDGFGAGMTALLIPADGKTQTAAMEARLSAYPVTFTIDSDTRFVEIIRADAAKAPDIQLRFAYLILKTEASVAPSAAIIGVDAYGAGTEGGAVGGVDADAVKDIIKQVMPAWTQSENPPEDAVKSVNGKTGAVNLNASDVGARPSTWTPTAANVGADPAGTAENKTADLREEVNGKLADYDKSTSVNNKISSHNTETDAHNDIRLLLQGLSDRLNALAALLNSDDINLDETKEIVAYIKSNKTLIDGITSSKVNVTDIVDNLITNSSKYPLSAAQGVALKLLIDALTTTVNSKVTESQVTTAISNALQKAHESGEFDGKDGKTPVKGVDYYTDEDKAELISELSKIPAPVIVSSVDEMTDTTKHYVNQSTGTIWAYQKHEKNVEASTKPNFTNVFNPDTAEIGYRWSGSSKAPQAQDKCTLSDFIACDLSSGEHTIRIKNAQLHGNSTNAGIAYFTSNTADSQIEFVNNNNLTPTEEADGVFAYKLGEKNGSMLTNYAITRFIRCVYVKKVGDSMQNATESIARNVIITIDEPITYTDVPASTEVYYEWTDTGISYAPTFKTDMIGVMSEDNVIYVSDNALPSGDYTLKASNGDVIGTYTVE